MHRFGDSSLDFYGADKQTDCWTNRQTLLNSIIFAARRYASAVYAVVVCRPSVRHNPVFYRNNWTNRAGFGMEASFHLGYPTLCYKEIWVSPKIRALPSGTLSQTPNLENFATASRSRYQQNSSSTSTVELVDHTCTTVDESWLFTASRSTVPSQYCVLLL